MTGQPLIGWNAKTGLLTIEPAQVLRFATKTMDHFGEGSRNEQEAFCAGLVLDLMSALAEQAGPRKAAVRKFIEDRYYELLRHADKAIAAGKGAQKLVLENAYITTVLLMGLAGEAALAIYFADYLELLPQIREEADSPRAAAYCRVAAVRREPKSAERAHLPGHLGAR